jgi:predicted Zn-dependent peptidase
MGKVIPPAEVIQKLSATTPEGVQKLAKRLFAKPPTIALVGPELAADGHWYLQTVVGTGEKNGIDGAH